MTFKTMLLSHAHGPRRKKLRRRWPKTRAPKNIEREYERALVPYLDHLNTQVKHHVLNRLHSFASDATAWRPLKVKRDGDTELIVRMDGADDIMGALDGIKEALKRDYTFDELRTLAKKYGMSVAEFNEYALKKGFKTVTNIDVGFDQPYLKEELNMFAINNANLIEGIGESTVDRISDLVFRGLQQGRLYEDIAQDIEGMSDPDGGFSRNRARLIARDQVNKLNGQLNGLRQQELGIEGYLWRGMLDERERDSHIEKEGQFYAWDDPPTDTGHPGEDIQCRCYAEPDIQGLLDGEGDDQDDTEAQDE